MLGNILLDLPLARAQIITACEHHPAKAPEGKVCCSAVTMCGSLRAHSQVVGKSQTTLQSWIKLPFC